MKSAKKITAYGLLLTLLTAATAHADGECGKGFRDTTTDERANMTRVLETARAALPAAPEGWIIGGYEEISVPSRICMDVETTPWPYNISRTYNRTDNVAERDRALANAGATMQAALAAKQPRMDAIMARMQTLGAELAHAAQQGNQARVDAINTEIEQLSKQFESLTNEGDTQAQVAAVAAATMRDVEMSIAVAVNPGAVSNSDMQRTAAPAGAQQAFRWQTTADGVIQAHALVLLGSWRPRAEGGIEPVKRDNAPAAAAHVVSFHVTADPARIDALIAGIDFGAAAALLR